MKRFETDLPAAGKTKQTKSMKDRHMNLEVLWFLFILHIVQHPSPEKPPKNTALLPLE